MVSKIQITYNFWAVVLLAALLLLVAWVLPSHLSAQGGTVSYADVNSDDTHYSDITSLAEAGIFEGTECESGQFCPNDGITRRVFAVWLVRALEQEEPIISQQDMSRFEDVDINDPETPYITRLAQLGVTVGCSSDPPRFCPDQYVSRAQMASFLVRAFDMPEAESAGFTDVSENNSHVLSINRLAAVGVTKGCAVNPLRYCPDKITTRSQMASFLSRAMNWQQSTQLTQIIKDPPRSSLGC